MFEFAASMFIIGVAVAVVVTVYATRPVTLTAVQKHGPIDPGAVCPHCGAEGAVHARSVRLNDGISTPKLVAGALTGGLALLAVGVHRRRAATERHCARCEQTWRA